ncbi:hypothetical protein ABK040_010768 [Willaertia magna]
MWSSSLWMKKLIVWLLSFFFGGGRSNSSSSFLPGDSVLVIEMNKNYVKYFKLTKPASSNHHLSDEEEEMLKLNNYLVGSNINNNNEDRLDNRDVIVPMKSLEYNNKNNVFHPTTTLN